jgi:hypothetical protein
MSHKQKKNHPISQPQNQIRVSNSSGDKESSQDGSSIITRGEKNQNKKGASKRRRWSRRILWIVVIVIAITLILRISLWASLPWILNKTMKGYNLQCSYEKLSFSILTGDAELWHMTIKSADSNESLLYIEYVRAEVSTTTLFAQQLIVPRVEIDGMDINIVRASDGSFPQFERFLRNTQTKNNQVIASTKPIATEARQKEINLTPPVKLDAMRFQHVQINFRDQSVTPVFESRLDMNVRLSDLSSKKRNTRFQVTLSCPPILDQIILDGTGSCLGMDLLANMKFAMNSLHPQVIKNYLTDLGIVPNSENINISCNCLLTTKGIERLVNPRQVTAQKKTSEPIPRILNVQMALSDIALNADNTENYFLKTVAIDANIPQTNDIQIAKIALAGGHAHLWKDTDNAFYTAGLKFSHKTDERQMQSPKREDTIVLYESHGQTITADTNTGIFNWSVDDLSLDDLQFIFHDKSISPNTDLAFVLKSLDIENINSKNVSAMKIQSELSVPGVIAAVHLEGTADILSQQKQLALKLSADGIKPDIVSPYMKKAGLESLYQNGRFTCDVNAAIEPLSNGYISGSASVRNILLQDTSELFGLAAIDIKGISFDPNTKNTRIENVDISGQRLAIGRDENGRLNILGMRIIDSQNQSTDSRLNQNKSAQIPQQKTESNLNQLTRSIPRIQIGRFSWHDNTLTISDRAISPVTSIRIPDFGFQLDDFDLNFSGEQAATTKLVGWLQAPGIIERTILNGSLTTKQAGVSVKLDVTSNNLSAEKIAPYMRALGIESSITDGDFRAALDANLDWSADVPNCSVNVHDVAVLNNDANTIARLKSLVVDKLRVESGNLIIDKVELDQPYIAISREQTGTLNLAGIRLLDKQPANIKPAPNTKPKEISQPTSQPTVTISNIGIKKGQLLWSDNAVAPAISQILSSDMNITDFSMGQNAEPSVVNIDIEIPDIIKKAVISGTLQLKTTQQVADLKLDLSGIATDKVTSYFSGNLKPDLKDAALKGKIKADISQRQSSGYKIDFEIGNLDYRDNSKQDSLLKFDLAKFVIDQLDQNARIVAVKELTVEGFESGGERIKPDVFSILGINLLSKGTDSNDTKTTEKLPVQSQQTINNGSKKSNRFPLISLETLNLQLKKFTLKDQTKSAAEPIILSDFQIRNAQPIRLFAEESDVNSVVSIDVKGKIQPLMESFVLKTEVSPFTSKPLLHAELDLNQIHTSQLTNIMPDLSNIIDTNSLSNLQFAGKTDLTLLLDRQDILNFDAGKPFGLEMIIKNIQLVDTEKKTILAGFDELNVNIPRIDLPKQKIHIKEIGLVKPQGSVSMENDGLHVLGLTLKSSAKKAASDVNNVVAEKKLVTQESGTQKVDNKTADANKPEILVDQLLVSGIDFTYVDRTVKPVMYIPIKGLDVEFRGFTNNPTEKTAPMLFNVMITSGEVSLPQKGRGQSPDNNNVTSSATQQRLLFQEIAASGNLSLYPKPDGWVKAGISGMELVNYKGTAGRAGVVLNNGVLDASVDLRFKKTGSISTRSQFVFTDLSLTEPPDGFLKKLLSLPTSLDTVIFILQDSSGAIRLPVSLTLDEKGISSGQIVSAAIGVTASLIANAVANSPLRVAGTVTDILGVSKKEPNNLETYTLQYAPGVTTLSGEQVLKLEELIKHLKKDKKVAVTIRHELGGGDIFYAGSLVNPSNSDTIELISKLQRQKADLYLERDTLASQTKAAYAAGISNRPVEKMQSLQEIERNIGLIERSLDDLLDMMRPGSEHLATRRTRDASILIGKARLDAIADFFATKDIPDVQNRITFIAPRFNDVQGNNGGSITIQLQIRKAS